MDTSRCKITDEAPSGIFFKEKRSSTKVQVFYYRKHSAASHMKPEDLNEEYIAGAKILHLTGITPALSLSCLETVFSAIQVAKKHQVKIVFDPNIRLKLWKKKEAKKVLLEIASQADFVLPGIEEGQLLTGLTTSEEIASFFLDHGSKVVVVKLGSQGAYYQTSQTSGYVQGFPVSSVVDPVGAGDGFAAGFISGVLRNEELELAVKRANAMGAMVVGINGDIYPGRSGPYDIRGV